MRASTIVPSLIQNFITSVSDLARWLAGYGAVRAIDSPLYIAKCVLSDGAVKLSKFTIC